jgi:hypothetical protein
MFKMRHDVQMTSRNVYQNLYKHHTRLDVRKNFFPERVINDWNKLPLELKTAQDKTTFKFTMTKLSRCKEKRDEFNAKKNKHCKNEQICALAVKNIYLFPTYFGEL